MSDRFTPQRISTPSARLRLLAALLATAVLSPAAGVAQQEPPAAGARRLTITRAGGPIAVDGRLDEPAWADALRFDLPYEHFPGDNSAPPVATVFSVTYDDQYLYAAWRCADPAPEQIRAHLMDRDESGTFFQDDHVLLTIDPFNDERRGFQFRINPLGVQMDAVFSENEGSEDFAFDMIWRSAGRIVGDGYVVEIAIPLDQLRFSRRDGPLTWGFDVGRWYPRRVRYRIASYPHDRGRSCVLCQIDKVTGFEDLEPGRNLELTPTVTAQRADARQPFPEGRLETGEDELDLGLSVRWGLSPSMTLSAAVNPDFSQVEADAAQLDVNQRFALFFDEKRPFFLEGTDIFSTPLPAVFTRSVVDPDWGVKLTGKEGPHDIGVFATGDAVNNLLLPSNQRSILAQVDDEVTAGVARYRRDVGTGSTIGLLYAGRQGSDYHNDVYGADAYLRLDAANTLNVQVLRSDTAYPQEVVDRFGEPAGSFSGNAIFGQYSYRGRYWNGSLAYRELDPTFRADSGFVARVDTREGRATLERQFYGGEDDWYTRFNVGGAAQHTEDHQGQLTDAWQLLYANVSGPLQSFVQLTVERRKERYEGILHEELEKVELMAEVQPNDALRLSLFVEAGEQVDLANNQPADAFILQPAAELKLGRHVNLKLDHAWQRFEVPAGTLFEVNLSQLRLVYNINVRTFVRAVFQYQDLERNPGLFVPDLPAAEQSLFTQLLFSYKVNPRTVAFFGYTDRRLGDVDINLTQSDRSLFFKIGYAWSL